MARDLYQVLEISNDATPEQSVYPWSLRRLVLIEHPVRKAYKKRALQTHPDRLPPGASAGDKSSAEEEFRKVSALDPVCVGALNIVSLRGQ